MIGMTQNGTSVFNLYVLESGQTFAAAIQSEENRERECEERI